MSDDTPRYMISVAADLVGMHPQTLRIYETKGLVTPQRTAGNTRLYSDADLERLRLIQQLTTELGLNLAGVEHVIRLEEQIRRMQRTMERLEREMREAIAAGAQAVPPRPRSLRPHGLGARAEDMDFQRLTVKSQEAIAAAQELARRRGNPEIVPDHLLRRAPRPGAAADAARRAGGRSARRRRRPISRACPRCRARRSSPARRPRSPASSTAPRRRCASSRTSSSRRSTCCSRSTSFRATSCSRS